MSTIDTSPLGADSTTVDITPELLRKRRSQGRIIFDRFMRNRLAVGGAVVLLIMVLAAIFAPLLTHQTATYDPASKVDLAHLLEGPTAAHPLGTDDLGRDEFARLLEGARVSLLVGFASMFIGLVVGITIGAIAGFYGRWLDNVMMRITDAILSVPLYLLLFVLSASFFSNGTITDVVILIAFFSWAPTARIVRGEFLSIKEREYLYAARTLGASDLRLMFMHALPNAIGPIIVAATLLIGNNIILESTLSFFGFGIQPPQSSWGTMLATAQSYIFSDALLVFVPGLAILLTVLSFNLLGDGLRDALDPYMTER
ncbi:MAG: ABC transporter permease [Nitrososphaerota archaeon]